MENWIFENNNWLWGLFIIPVLILVFILRQQHKKKQFSKLGTNYKQLIPLKSVGRIIFKNSLILLAFISLIIGLANPQVGVKTSKVKLKGAEIIIALDISNSMKAQDMSPNRLDKAKLEISRLLKYTKSDRVGLIVFAGKAFMNVPLTTDYARFRMYLKSVDTDYISTQGTDISEAIRLASESFTENSKNNKALIIITDGENHEEAALFEAEEASKKGIAIHTIGLGDRKGVPIPFRTRRGLEYRKDSDGNLVVTKLNEQLLNEIATIGKGRYLKAQNSGFGLESIYNDLKQMEKEEFEQKSIVDGEDDFQLYLAIALILLLLEFIILPRKNSYFAKINLNKDIL